MAPTKRVRLGGRAIQDVSHFLDRASISGFLHILERVRGLIRDPGEYCLGLPCAAILLANLLYLGPENLRHQPVLARFAMSTAGEAVSQKLVPVLPLSHLLTTPASACCCSNHATSNTTKFASQILFSQRLSV